MFPTPSTPPPPDPAPASHLAPSSQELQLSFQGSSLALLALLCLNNNKIYTLKHPLGTFLVVQVPHATWDGQKGKKHQGNKVFIKA